MEIFLLVLGFAIALAFYNGWFLIGASKSWHAMGFVLRFVPIIFIDHSWTARLVYFWVAWIVYDIIINKIRRDPWHYTGDSSWIERNIPTAWLWFCKIALTFVTVGFILSFWFNI